MKRNAMRKNLRQSILKSFGRYLAIIMIIALGASMFVGLLMTKFDMVATGQKFMDEQNMFDLRLISPYGWELDHPELVAQMEGVEDAEGVVYLDAIANYGEDGQDSAYRFYAIPERMNQIALRGGRMPESPDECLADGYFDGEGSLGKTVTISVTNEESVFDYIRYKTFTVVGYVATPLYMDMNRGTTTIGSGSLSNYFYVQPEALELDYYPEINVTIPGQFEIYSDEYDQALEDSAEKLEPMVEPLVKDRFQAIRDEAMAEYEDGLREYEDGLKTYEEEKAKALQELEDAHQKLLDAEDEIAKNEDLLAYSQYQIDLGWEELQAGEAELEDAKRTLQEARSTVDVEYVKALEELEKEEQALIESNKPIETELIWINTRLEEINSSKTEISDLDREIAELSGRISATADAIEEAERRLNELPFTTPKPVIDAAEAALEELREQKIEDEILLEQKLADRESQNVGAGELTKEEEDLLARRDELLAQKSRNDTELEVVRMALDNADEALAEVLDGLEEAEAEIKSGEAQLIDGRNQLVNAQIAVNNGRKELEEGKVELADGWVEYEEGKLEAEEEFAKAEAELEDAKLLLDDALDTINSMEEGSVYVLDRNSNIGYGSLNSASDIVFGVSRVLPAFFLLVAALVCITTMTRMIDEERTQIGTLKALGYSNGAIISKYLFYAGSGAVIGCGLGVLAGSMIFPTILWEAYKIMLYITPGIVVEFNWPLCLIVVAAYTAVMLFVTWYCCRRSLLEEPAELIRPKAPEAGKKILMEYLPFWQKISFLNKVTIRNIFRYRQRLAMMLVGIGGCTALLLTGFGLRDSIVNVVDYQFENVTLYDMMVYFSEGQTEEQQDRFIKLTDDCADNVMFYNHSSVEVEYNNQVKAIYLMAAGSRIQEFMDFHRAEEQLSLPSVNEVLLSAGVSENLGIRVGDQVIMRNGDMEQLELTVSGIYDNHVDNYAVIIPETIEAQWGRTPEAQVAMVQVSEDQDVYEASTVITELSDVMSVAISEEFAAMVGSMMDALDLVVWVIVFCAGLLAAIVLYNLTNININERIREIATIKVLGFNASETAAYVFKENVALTVIGSGFGLGLGYLLLLFVMSQIKIDMVWFKALIMWPSYVWSIVLTMLAACIVNFVFYFKLDKINMAEALKSVE